MKQSNIANVSLPKWMSKRQKLRAKIFKVFILPKFSLNLFTGKIKISKNSRSGMRLYIYSLTILLYIFQCRNNAPVLVTQLLSSPASTHFNCRNISFYSIEFKSVTFCEL